MQYTIILKGKNIHRFKAPLKKRGFSYDGRNSQHMDCWKIDTDDESLVKWSQRFSLLHSMSCTINENNYSRSHNYRKVFFEEYSGINNTNIYCCAYCGRLMPVSATTVDHLIPVNAVQKGFARNFYKKLLKLAKIDNINNPKNLVAACKSCNSRKGSKTGFWIVRGLAGKHFSFWIGLIAVLFLAVCILVISHCL